MTSVPRGAAGTESSGRSLGTSAAAADAASGAEPGSGGAPSATAAPTSGRRTRPHANLPDDLGDLGDHAVGSPKDDVRRLRTQAAWARVWVALLVTGAVVGLIALWHVSLVRRRAASSAVAASSPGDAASTSEIAAASRAAVAVDSLAPLAPILPAPLATDSLAGVRGLVGGIPGTRESGSGALSPGAAPLLGPFDTPDGPRGIAVPAGLAPTAQPTAPGSSVSPSDDHAAGVGSLTLLQRMQRADGFGGTDGLTSDYGVVFAARRSPLATGPAPQASSGLTAASGGAGAEASAFVPGTRAKAHILVTIPSAADGEPIEAILDDSLVNRGVMVLPAGTRAIGRGTAFDDGTASPRLMVHFTTFVLPDQSVRTLSGLAYAIEDGRPGIPVEVNHQVLRKATRIAEAAGVAGATAMAVNSLPQQQSGSVFNQEPPGNEALRQAYDQTFQTMDQEIGLNRPPVAEILKLAAGREITIVFGMAGPASGGA